MVYAVYWLWLVTSLFLSQHVSITQTKASGLFHTATDGHYATLLAREYQQSSDPYVPSRSSEGKPEQNVSGLDADNKRVNSQVPVPPTTTTATATTESTRKLQEGTQQQQQQQQQQHHSRYRNLRRLIEELSNNEDDEEDSDEDEYAAYGSWGNFPSREGHSNRYFHASTGASLDPSEYERVFQKAKAKLSPNSSKEGEEADSGEDSSTEPEEPGEAIDHQISTVDREQQGHSKGSQRESTNEQGYALASKDESPLVHATAVPSMTSPFHPHSHPSYAFSSSHLSPPSGGVALMKLKKMSTLLPTNKSMLKMSAMAAVISIVTFASVKPFTLPLLLFQQQFMERMFAVFASFSPSLIMLFVALFAVPQPMFDVNLFLDQVFSAFFKLYPALLCAEVVLTTGTLLLGFKLFASTIFEEHPDIPGVLLPWVVSLDPKLFVIAKGLIEGILLPMLHVWILRRAILSTGKRNHPTITEHQTTPSLVEIYGLACGLKFAKLTIQVARSFHTWSTVPTSGGGGGGGGASPILQAFTKGLFPIPELIAILVFKSTSATKTRSVAFGWLHAFFILSFSALRGNWQPLYFWFTSTMQQPPTTFSPSMLWKSYGSVGLLIKYGMDMLYSLVMLQACVKAMKFGWKRGNTTSPEIASPQPATA